MTVFKSSLLAVLVVGSLSGCEKTTVDASDVTPPVLEIFSTPDATYLDGSSYSEPIDVNRDILLIATQPGGLFPDMSFIARDRESSISQIRVTIDAEVNCLRRENNTIQTKRAVWTEEENHPDPAGSDAYISSNILLHMTPRTFIKKADCFTVQSGGQDILLDSAGIRGNVNGTYYMTACNNSAGTPAQRCSNIVRAGRFRLTGGDGMYVARDE